MNVGEGQLSRGPIQERQSRVWLSHMSATKGGSSLLEMETEREANRTRLPLDHTLCQAPVNAFP